MLAVVNLTNQLVLCCRSDSDRSVVPADIIFHPGGTADGHVAWTGHVETTPGEHRYLVTSVTCLRRCDKSCTVDSEVGN